MNNIDKPLGTKWMSFIYGWFIFSIVVVIIGTLSSVVQIMRMKEYYGSLYQVNGLVYVIIFFDILRVIYKILACKTKYKSNGYIYADWAMGLDAFSAFLYGLRYSFVTGLVSCAILLAIVIPSIIYFNKRKYIYARGINGIYSEFPESQAESKTQTEIVSNPKREITFCRKCGTKLSDGSVFCRKCGTQIIDPGMTDQVICSYDEQNIKD